MTSEQLNPDQFTFFHGTRHRLKPGLIMEGGRFTANQGAGQPGEHVYFSSRADVAAGFAAHGMGPAPDYDAPPRVYQVEPIGEHEPDPDEAPEFGSFRSRQAKVIKEVRWASKMARY